MQYQSDWQCIEDRIFLLESLFLPPYHQLTSWKPLEICVSSLHHNRPKICNTNGLVINIVHDFILPSECYVSILSYSLFEEQFKTKQYFLYKVVRRAIQEKSVFSIQGTYFPNWTFFSFSMIWVLCFNRGLTFHVFVIIGL